MLGKLIRIIFVAPITLVGLTAYQKKQELIFIFSAAEHIDIVETTLL